MTNYRRLGNGIRETHGYPGGKIKRIDTKKAKEFIAETTIESVCTTEELTLNQSKDFIRETRGVTPRSRF